MTAEPIPTRPEPQPPDVLSVGATDTKAKASKNHAAIAASGFDATHRVDDSSGMQSEPASPAEWETLGCRRHVHRVRWPSVPQRIRHYRAAPGTRRCPQAGGPGVLRHRREERSLPDVPADGNLPVHRLRSRRVRWQRHRNSPWRQANNARPGCLRDELEPGRHVLQSPDWRGPQGPVRSAKGVAPWYTCACVQKTSPGEAGT